MLLCVPINADDPRVVRATLAYHLNGLERTNRVLMAQWNIPALYQSGVKYQIDPDSSHMQRLLDCLEVIERRKADCKSLAAYRLAELRASCATEAEAMKYDFMITWREYDHDPIGVGLVPLDGVVRIFHVAIVKPNGSTEDPSDHIPRA